ncbi:MAG: hypothetical protein WCT10_01220 [Patescibacteria group bacterium]
MVKETVGLGLIRVWGKRYDLPLLVETTEFLVEQFRVYCGRGHPTVSLAGHPKKLDWPDPGRDHSRQAWQCYAAGADGNSGVERSVVYSLGPVTVTGYLLGSSHLALYSRLSILVDPAGAPAILPDPEPCLCILGAPNGETGEHRLLLSDTAEVLEELILSRHKPLQLGVRITNPILDNRGTAVMVTFPHDVYGAGFGPVDVDCTLVGSGQAGRFPVA